MSALEQAIAASEVQKGFFSKVPAPIKSSQLDSNNGASPLLNRST